MLLLKFDNKSTLMSYISLNFSLTLSKNLYTDDTDILYLSDNHSTGTL